MGRDIHMHIIKDNIELAHDIYDGRNSEWFDNLTNCHCSEPAYEYLPARYHWDNISCPKDLYDKYTKPAEGEKICYYYDHRAIQVGDFRKWYNEYKPFLKAGYVTKYDAWLYKKKNIPPDPDLLERHHWVDNEADSYIKDKIWIEFVYPYEQSNCIIDYLDKNSISDDAWIIYCFDW